VTAAFNPGIAVMTPESDAAARNPAANVRKREREGKNIMWVLGYKYHNILFYIF
jgi:hypothetical protein